MTPSPLFPAIFLSFLEFWQNRQFSKENFKCLQEENASCIFQELSNLYFLFLLISFFPFLLWLTAENNVPIWRNYLFELQSYAGLNITNCTWLFISSTATAIIVIFWTKRDSALFLIAEIHSTTNLANTKSSSEESLKEKRHSFIVVFPFHLAQYANTEFISQITTLSNI